MSPVVKTRDELIVECQDLVRSLAWKVFRGFSNLGSVEVEDLIGFGEIGLAEAARDFDPQRGVVFSTFAYYRIRGAIYDGLSKMTGMTRSQYSHLRYEQMANEVMKQESEDGNLKGVPSIRDSAKWLKGLSSSLAVVYVAAYGNSDGDQEEIPVEDESTPTPPSAAIARETSARLHELVAQLPENARTLIQGIYFEGLTLQKAGERIGISKAWASRLHAKTLRQLGHFLESQGVV